MDTPEKFINLKNNMKYVSIDIETTGLDRERFQILSIGAIIEDTEKKLPFNEIPKFHAAIKHKEILGSLYALNMNSKLISAIVEYQCAEDQETKQEIEKIHDMKFLNEEDVVEAFFQFLYINEIPDNSVDFSRSHFHIVDGHRVPKLSSNMPTVHLTVAGKNFSTFDKLFLERLPRWKQCIRIRQRILDPAILYTDWKNDESLPGLFECKRRAKIDGIVSHNAIEDAWDVIQLLRKEY